MATKENEKEGIYAEMMCRKEKELGFADSVEKVSFMGEKQVLKFK